MQHFGQFQKFSYKRNDSEINFSTKLNNDREFKNFRASNLVASYSTLAVGVQFPEFFDQLTLNRVTKLASNKVLRKFLPALDSTIVKQLIKIGTQIKVLYR